MKSKKPHPIFHFLLQKLALSALALFAIATLTFILMHIAPGDPFCDDPLVNKAALENLKSYYGLNDAWYVQYIRYIVSIFSFDFGPSLKYTSQSVNAIIMNAFPVSLTVGITALLIAIPLGFITGAIATLSCRGWKNLFWTMVTIVGVSIPSFVVAAVLQLIFSILLPIFPVARWGTPMHIVLPSIALSIRPASYIARILRASMLEVLHSQYIQTAQLKGLKKWRIIAIHVTKNALLPILGYMGPVTTDIIVGSCVVERVFALPGLGQWFVQAVFNRDYPLIGGLTIFYSIVLLIVHTVIDGISQYITQKNTPYLQYKRVEDEQ